MSSFEVDNWVAEKAAAALRVTAFHPDTGRSRELQADELEDVLTLLLHFDAAKAGGRDLSDFEERFAELGLSRSWYDTPSRRSRPLFKAEGGGVEHTGHHLRSLLETARDAARTALNLPRVRRLQAWDITIFVVDDSDTAREVLGFMLRKLGFTVDLFASADELLRALEDESAHPHLIMMDLMMPKVNGFEITRQLQEGSRREIPVVIVTGKKMDDAAVSDLRGEPNVKEFLSKPFTDDKLRDVVSRALSVRID